MPEDYTVSNNERNFIRIAIKDDLRLDGRRYNEHRKVRVQFGADWGTAYISLGHTQVLGSVRCEIDEPNTTRPQEGTVYINVGFSEVCGIEMDPNDLIMLNRLLDRTFRESHSIDLESLCVKAENHVWALRVDITIIAHDGNLNDACTIATLASLMHFRRPDVSLIEDEVLIHRAEEKEYIPILLHHFPITVTYVLCNEGKNLLADPLLNEEKVAESKLTIGINSYQELCVLNLGGSTTTNVRQLLKHAKMAVKRSKEVVELLRHALDRDLKNRDDNKGAIGLHQLLDPEVIGARRLENYQTKMYLYNFIGIKTTTNAKNDTYKNDGDIIVQSKSNNIPQKNLTQSGNKWLPDDEDDAGDGAINDEGNVKSSDNENDSITTSAMDTES